MKVFKKIFVIVSIVIAVATAVYFYIKFRNSGRELSDYVLPKLQQVETQLVNLNAERADMHVNMLIYNPSPVSLSIDSIYYTVSVEGTQIAKSTYPHPLKISANKDTKVSFPLSVRFKNLKSLMDRMEKEKRDSANYHLDAEIYIKSKIIPKHRFDLQFDKMLPMIWFPEVTLKGINVDKVRLNGGVILADMEVKNKNVFDLSFKNLSYQMKLGDNDWIGGKKSGVVDIPAKQSAEVSMPVDMKLGEMSKSLIDMLLKGDDLKYQLKMKASLISNNKIIRESKIQMDASGNMKSIKEALENQKK